MKRSFLLRTHMFLILTGTFLGGLLCTKLLFELNVDVLAIRYVVSVAFAYGVFLLLIRLWLWYVRIRVQRERLGVGDVSVDLLEVFADTASEASPAFGAQGGNFSGAGATEAYGDSVANVADETTSDVTARPSGCVDLDEGVVVVLFLGLVLTLFAVGGYLVYAAPAILADAAVEALLAAALARRARRIDSPSWAGSVFRATAMPLVAVLLFAVLLGAAVDYFCPDARRLFQIADCL